MQQRPRRLEVERVTVAHAASSSALTSSGSRLRGTSASASAAVEIDAARDVEHRLHGRGADRARDGARSSPRASPAARPRSSAASTPCTAVNGAAIASRALGQRVLHRRQRLDDRVDRLLHLGLRRRRAAPPIASTASCTGPVTADDRVVRRARGRSPGARRGSGRRRR